VVDQVLTAKAGHQRHTGQHLRQEIDGRFAPAAATGDRERAGSRAEQERHLCSGVRAHVGSRVWRRRHERRLARLVQHVLGQPDHHRPWPARARDRPRSAHHFRHARRLVEFVHPLADRPEGLAEVELLERIAATLVSRYQPDEHQQRCLVLLRGVNADGRVEHTRPAGDHQHPGATGELAMCLGGERGATLVTACHEPQPRRVVERVEHGEVALAGHTEGNIGAERDQLVDECSCGGRHPLPLCSRAGGPSSAASHMAVRPRSFAHDPSLRAH